MFQCLDCVLARRQGPALHALISLPFFLSIRMRKQAEVNGFKDSPCARLYELAKKRRTKEKMEREISLTFMIQKAFLHGT